MTEQLITLLPPPEKVRAQQVMKMVCIKLSDQPHHKVDLNITAIIDGQPTPVSALLCQITDPSVAGHLPSKVWCRDDEIYLLFYASESIPEDQRPFGSGRSFVAALGVRHGVTIEYDLGTRMYNDQVQTEAGTVYLFMFGDDSYDKLVVQKAGDVTDGSTPIALDGEDLVDELLRAVQETQERP